MIIESTVILSAGDFVINHGEVLAHDIKELEQQSCSLGHVYQEGCAWFGSRTAFVVLKAKIKQWIVFGVVQVTDVLFVFTFTIWNVFTQSISDLRKIFVSKGGLYIFFVPFSYTPNYDNVVLEELKKKKSQKL